jgi:putative tricarboxylic transport membrane protein
MKENRENSTRDESWRRNFNYNTVTAIVFLILWTIMFFAIPYQIQKPMLFMGRSLMGLKPTLFPQIATLALIFLNIWYLVISFRIKDKNLFTEVTRQGYFRVIASLVVFCAYALLFEHLGFVLSSILVAGSLSTFYGNRDVLVGALVSVGVPVGIYLVFTRLLKVSLPEFPLF